MKKLALLFLILLCCGFSVKAQYDEMAEEAYERGRQLLSSHQFNRTLFMWDSLTRHDISADLKAKYLTQCGFLCRDSLNDHVRAISYFNAVEGLYPQLLELQKDEIHTNIVYASMALAEYADTLGHYPQMVVYYEKAIELCNRMLIEGIGGVGMIGNDLDLMLLSFKQSRAVAYGRCHRFEDAESAFEELKFSYAQMEQSDDAEIKEQGWMFGCMLRYQYAQMYDNEMRNSRRALEEMNTLLSKIKEGLSNTELIQTLSDQIPVYLMFTGHLNLVTKNPQKAIAHCNDALKWPESQKWRPLIQNIRGEAFLQLGKLSEANLCWQEIIRLNPHFYDGIEKSPLNSRFVVK